MTRVCRRFVSATLLVQAGCAGPPPTTAPIVIDGSSTLAPLTDAVVADFQKTHRYVPIKLASVGTAEGFGHFCRGELDILDASRPVSPAEQAVCVDTYVRRAGELALGAGAAPLMGTSYELVSRRLTKGTTGTMFKTSEDRREGIDLLLNQ